MAIRPGAGGDEVTERLLRTLKRDGLGIRRAYGPESSSQPTYLAISQVAALRFLTNENSTVN